MYKCGIPLLLTLRTHLLSFSPQEQKIGDSQRIYVFARSQKTSTEIAISGRFGDSKYHSSRSMCFGGDVKHANLENLSLAVATKYAILGSHASFCFLLSVAVRYSYPRNQHRIASCPAGGVGRCQAPQHEGPEVRVGSHMGRSQCSRRCNDMMTEEVKT